MTPPAPPSTAVLEVQLADPEVARTRRLDLASSLLTSGFLAVIEMGGAIAKKGFQASDLEVALLTSGQSAGLILSFFIAHLASKRTKMSLVFWPELLSRVLLLPVFFLRPTFALVFVVLHALAQMFQAMTTPARVTIYRLNYPSESRGRIVGRIRQLQLLLTALFALLMSLALDWSVGDARIIAYLGPPAIPAAVMINYSLPVLAGLGLFGSFIFRRVRVKEPPLADVSISETFRRFLKVWREDGEFRRYENFFFLFGFANIMSIPLTQIHAVDALKADYFDLALINVVLVQGLMALTMVFWGRQLDRHTPAALRGFLNVIFSVDFLLLAVAPSIGWVYVGRIFRGVALGGGTLVWMLGSLYYARTGDKAPVYLGIHTVLTGVRWLTAPFVGVTLKAVFGQNARPIFFLSFVVILGSALLMIREARRQVPRPPPPESPMPAPRATGA